VVGYGTKKKVTLTGAVVTVSGRDVQQSPATNLTNSLVGRLPGLAAINRSREPGADASSLRIRGTNTLGNSSPLIVVDGIANRSMDRIEPTDIESITVLKDASAAIYGAQAANGVMEVTPEIAMIVSAYQKGIRNYDVNKLYAAVKHNGIKEGIRSKFPGNGLVGMERLNVYNRLGYVPYEIDASCRTLDYAYTDFCAAQLAKAMKKDTDYKFFERRSNNWKNQFNPELKMQVPKDSSGNWMKNYDPFSGKHWIEGNGWQYTWYIPHDIEGLVTLMGKDLFNKRLEEGFEKSGKYNYTAFALDRAQNTSFEYYVNHGNEVNMQASFLFNYSGKPWLTQKYSRAILDKFYGNTPYHGWEGDEDEGQMSGWFVFASMGLFEMNTGE